VWSFARVSALLAKGQILSRRKRWINQANVGRRLRLHCVESAWFIVNRDGIVYQKDLGARTAARAMALRQYDPDATWKRVD
jgi:hypothetical protein